MNTGYKRKCLWMVLGRGGGIYSPKNSEKDKLEPVSLYAIYPITDEPHFCIYLLIYRLIDVYKIYDISVCTYI